MSDSGQPAAKRRKGPHGLPHKVEHHETWALAEQIEKLEVPPLEGSTVEQRRLHAAIMRYAKKADAKRLDIRKGKRKRVHEQRQGVVETAGIHQRRKKLVLKASKLQKTWQRHLSVDTARRPALQHAPSGPPAQPSSRVAAPTIENADDDSDGDPFGSLPSPEIKVGLAGVLPTRACCCIALEPNPGLRRVHVRKRFPWAASWPATPAARATRTRTPSTPPCASPAESSTTASGSKPRTSRSAWPS